MNEELFTKARDLIVRCRKCGAAIKDQKGLIEYCGDCLKLNE
jgi:hypothetical protein